MNINVDKKTRFRGRTRSGTDSKCEFVERNPFSFRNWRTKADGIIRTKIQTLLSFMFVQGTGAKVTYWKQVFISSSRFVFKVICLVKFTDGIDAESIDTSIQPEL